MKNTLLSLLFLVISTGIFAQKKERTQCMESELKTLPVLWQQTSAEYRALCYQSFNLAKLRVDQLSKKDLKKQLAIITDLDETIIDNSPSEVVLINECQSYNTANWTNWTNKSAARAIPGAVDFLQYANKKGIRIFYLSNRDTATLKSTLINLKKLNLPDAQMENMLFSTGGLSKEERRKKVSDEYQVVLLLGDNLGDFSEYFDKKTIDQRFEETDKVQDEWGKKFIVLPNATYGEWENVLYDYERKLSPDERHLKRQSKIRIQ